MGTPDGYRIKESYRVRFEEVDSQGIVNHVQYAHYFTGARVAYFRALGYRPAELTAMTVLPVVVHLEIDFRTPAHFDDHLDVWARVPVIGETSFAFAYQVVDGVNGGLVAEGQTVIVTLELSSHRPVRVPDDLRRRIETIEGRP